MSALSWDNGTAVICRYEAVIMHNLKSSIAVIQKMYNVHSIIKANEKSVRLLWDKAFCPRSTEAAGAVCCIISHRQRPCGEDLTEPLLPVVRRQVPKESISWLLLPSSLTLFVRMLLYFLVEMIGVDSPAVGDKWLACQFGCDWLFVYGSHLRWQQVFQYIL